MNDKDLFNKDKMIADAYNTAYVKIEQRRQEYNKIYETK